MARIRSYDQQVGAAADIPGRQASPMDFGAGAAEALGGVGAALGKAADVVQEVAERQEVTDVHAKLAQARADWTLELQKRATESAAGDPTLASKFTDDFSQSLQAMEGGIQTRAGQLAFRKGAAELSSHFVEKAGLYQAQSAGLKARQDYGVLLDSNRNTLITDPTQFESILKSTQDALTDPNGSYAKMSAEDREKLTNQTREKLALSAVQGVIRIAPELALKQLSDGRWDSYLDADKRYTLERSAEVAVRAREAAANHADALLEKARKDAAQSANNEYIAQFGTADKPGPLKLQTIIDDDTLPAFGVGSKNEWRQMFEARAKEMREKPIKTDPGTMMDLFARIHAPDGDSRKIIDENALNEQYLNKKLSFDDLARLRKEVADARTPEGEKLGKRRNDFITGISAQIDKSNPLMGKLDPSGKQALYEFSYYVDQKMQEYKAAGKNPHELFDPSKSDYLGKPEVLAGFQKTMQESMKNFSDRLRRQPGLDAPAAVPSSAPFDSDFNTKLSVEQEAEFKTWKAKNAPNDSGADYDLRGAFKAGLKPGADGHWPDTFKKPNHPTFSNESKYAKYGTPGHWEGQKFIPPTIGGVPEEKRRRPGETPAQYLQRTGS